MADAAIDPGHYLRRFRVTHGLSDSELVALLEQLEERAYSPNSALCEEGEETEGMFFVRKGSVSVGKLGRGDSGIELTQLAAPTVIGEIGLVTGNTATATVKAVTEVETMLLSHEHFEDMIKHGHPAASRLVLNIARIVAGRLDDTNAALVSLAESLITRS